MDADPRLVVPSRGERALAVSLVVLVIAVVWLLGSSIHLRGVATGQDIDVHCDSILSVGVHPADLDHETTQISGAVGDISRDLAERQCAVHREGRLGWSLLLSLVGVGLTGCYVSARLARLLRPHLGRPLSS